jgi:hypothetical protein
MYVSPSVIRGLVDLTAGIVKALLDFTASILEVLANLPIHLVNLAPDIVLVRLQVARTPAGSGV